MRALEPARSGLATNPMDGVRVHYEVFGSDDAERAIVFSPAATYIHGRVWKGQVPWLAQRGLRVVTWDARGSGGSDCPESGYSADYFAADLLAVMDAAQVQRAALVGITWAIRWLSRVAVRHPERVSHLISVSSFPTHFDTSLHPMMLEYFTSGPDPDVPLDWKVFHMRHDFRALNEATAIEDFPEPHSTKQIEDFVAWTMEGSPEALIAASLELFEHEPTAYYRHIACPTLLIHGSDDASVSPEFGRMLQAEIPGAELLIFEGSGHVPIARDPVRANLAIAEFIERDAPEPRVRTWQRAMSRPRRALFVSSPIGLGHVQRDLAVARELRRLLPDLRIDWLAQHLVTRVLEQAGETIHPLSGALASESAHWEQAAGRGGEHSLHCFHAFREMDEILLVNFMVFLDAVRETPYDLWIGDEAWEVDHFLHENPELKTAPYVFMTDFLGWLPIDRSPDSREAFLTADYNAEMLEHVARFPYVRDRAIYFGVLDDLVSERFGPDLPLIPDWTREHFTPVGYVVPYDPADLADTGALRERLGYDPDLPLAVCAVGGTSVGRPLLDRVLEAWPLMRREIPDARLVLVAGPRIDPETLAEQDGVRVLPYVHNLYEHLAAADLGIVQGGLGTTMELTVNRRPFLYFPLKDHCEQVFHVAHRLDCYDAGRRMDFAATSPAALAEAALQTIGSDTSAYRQHDPGGGTRAARLIADLF
ncbi:MAG TPA: alpha/beta fold hydrolase [Thermomicrobiales bacterium]|nr:alpha/beta fold hydrolase [Thermomicrobiales bacterium]